MPGPDRGRPRQGGARPGKPRFAGGGRPDGPRPGKPYGRKTGGPGEGLKPYGASKPAPPRRPRSRPDRPGRPDRSGARPDRPSPSDGPPGTRPEARNGPWRKERPKPGPRDSSKRPRRPASGSFKGRDSAARGLKAPVPSEFPELPKQWFSELKYTAKPGRAETALKAATAALDAFGREDYATCARLAVEIKNAAPRSGLARELLGLASYHSGNWQEAATQLLTYRRLTAALDEHHVIADCYRAMGRPDRALEVCEEVSKDKVEPEIWAEVQIVAAGAYADKGDMDRALAQLGRADLKPRSVQPYHLRLWYVQADLLDKLGRTTAARKIWEQIVAEEPDYFDVSQRLAVRPTG